MPGTPFRLALGALVVAVLTIGVGSAQPPFLEKRDWWPLEGGRVPAEDILRCAEPGRLDGVPGLLWVEPDHPGSRLDPLVGWAPTLGPVVARSGRRPLGERQPRRPRVPSACP